MLYQAATGASEVSARIRGGGARGWALGLYVSVGADASSLQRQHVRACVCVCVRVQNDAQTLRKMEGHLCPDVCWARLWLRADAHYLTWPNHTIACVPSKAQQDKYRGLNNYLYYLGGSLL